MNKKELCDLHNLTPEQFDGQEEYPGFLDLRSLTSIPDGFNPTVGGFLDLGSLTSIPDGFNPTVGGFLYLGRGLSAETKSPPKPMTWENCKYVSADGLFAEVVSKKTQEDRVIWKLKKINRDETYYMVEEDGLTAHGSSVKEAVIDLRFKSQDRDKSDYEDLTTDSEITFEDAVICYRVVTGACSFGVSEFLANRLKKQKERYLVSEIIDLTKDEYGGNAFANFFSAQLA